MLGKIPIMRRTAATLIWLALLAPSLGCAGRYSVGYRSGEGGEPSSGEGFESRALHIPPGHLPPPGSCRIWIPGVPPGQQSPPGDCERLASRVPTGAWLLTRPRDEPTYVEVAIYHEHRTGLVIDVELYIAATGKFVGHRNAR